MATKKHRLSNILGSKKEAGTPPQPQDTIQPKQSSETNGTTQPDSAYASSENSRDREMQHIDSNNDDGRNLAVDKKTGEVLDEDTGEVVTTVTTTTTTTTVTRTGGKGKGTQVGVTTQPGGGAGGSASQTPSPSHSPGPAGIAEAPGDSPSTPRQPPTHGQHLSPADANQPQHQQQQQQHSPASSTSSPAVETQHVYPKAEPQATHPALRQDQQQPPQQQPPPPNPQIPPRQPHRKSTDRPPPQYTDTNGYKDMPASPSTTHNNFSYPNPSRSQERLHRPSHQPPPPSSPETMHPGYHHSHQPSQSAESGATTAHNPLHQLKSAAIGLHGVGETLRGTLNTEVDNRLQRRNPSKNSAAAEKNARVMQRGEREMAGLREGRGLGTTVVPGRSTSFEGRGQGGQEEKGYVKGGGVQRVPARPREASFGQQQQQQQQPPMPRRFYGHEVAGEEGGGGDGQQGRRERSSSRVQALSQTNGGNGGGGGGSGMQGHEREREKEKEKEGKGGGLRKFLKGR